MSNVKFCSDFQRNHCEFGLDLASTDEKLVFFEAAVPLCKERERTEKRSRRAAATSYVTYYIPLLLLLCGAPFLSHRLPFVEDREIAFNKSEMTLKVEVKGAMYK